MRIRKTDVPSLTDGTRLWYAYLPGPSARTHSWSTEYDVTGAVLAYVLSDDPDMHDAISRNALLIGTSAATRSTFFTLEDEANAALRSFQAQSTPRDTSTEAAKVGNALTLW